MSLSRTNEDKNAAVEASGALLDGGTIVLYSGTAPADVNAALSSNDVLATGTFGNPAFGTASGGSVSANAITAGTGTAAAGVGTTATFYRTKKSDTTDTRQGKVFPVRAAKTTVSATATGFDDTGNDLFTDLGVGDSFTMAGFTNTDLNITYEVLSKTDNGTIATCPVPAATEAAGQSVTMTPYGLRLDNVSIAESQTVTFSGYSISGN